MFRKSFFILLALSLTLASCSSLIARRNMKVDSIAYPRVESSIEVNGLIREYAIHTPEKPTKLLLVLHGGGGDFKRIDQLTALSPQLAKNKDVILVYPNAIDNNWNDSRIDENGILIRKTDDVEFINNLIKKYQKQYQIPTSQTTISGISNGAIFANLYGCNSNLVGKLYSVVGSFPITAQTISTCPTTSIKEVTIINSLADKMVKYSGGPVGFNGQRGSVMSVEDTRKIWQNSSVLINKITLNQEGHIWPKSEFDATEDLVRFVEN
ncbi:MAG: hypothetical protein ACRCXZ_09045 [Patescibacteria group bacterium]